MSLNKLYFFWPKEIVKRDVIDRHLGPVVKASYRDQRYSVHPECCRRFATRVRVYILVAKER
jgi:hypothetical protein